MVERQLPKLLTWVRFPSPAPVSSQTLAWRGFFVGVMLVAIRVNGRAEALPEPATLEGLVDALSLTGQRLAIEHNGQIIPRSVWSVTAIADEDCIEIVKAIGGG